MKIRLSHDLPRRIAVSIFSALFLCAIVPAARSAEVRLWNKLGSDSEVYNSEYGPNGNIVGSSYAFEPAQFDDGYVRKATDPNHVEFPASIIHNLSYRGTIELWINPKVSAPVPYQYGVFALVGQVVTGPTVPVNRGNVYLYWGDGITGRGLYGGVRFDDQWAQTPSEPTQFAATVGVPFHTAIVWDIDGIDGGSDTIRVYRDGAIVGSTSGLWNPNGTLLEERFRLGQGPDAGGYDKFISDNIRVWNYAKTDFSDRFREDPFFYCEGDSFEPPFDVPLTLKAKNKRAIPVKMVLRDGDGALLTDADIAPPVVSVSYSSSEDPLLAAEPEALVPPGLADEGNAFRYDPYAGHWIVNLATKQFTSPGTYAVSAIAPAGGTYVIHPESCVGYFERLE